MYIRTHFNTFYDVFLGKKINTQIVNFNKALQSNSCRGFES